MEPSDYSIKTVSQGIIGEASEGEIEDTEDRQVIKSHLNLLLLESAFLSKSRKWWSGFLISCVAVSILFQIVITFSIGFGKLDYKGYESFLAVIAGGTFAQVVGLAAIALKWIFGGKRPDEMLEEMRVSRLNRR